MHQQKVMKYIRNAQMFWISIAGIVFAMLTYVIFVNSAVIQTAEREKLQDKIIALKSDISDLENKIITSERKIDINLAYNSGFEEAEDIVFINRDSVTQLSLNELRP